MQTLPDQREMYSALVKRDPAYDGVFFAAVKSTGIFCRPTCPARKPREGGVEYFGTAQQALLAGYRPCRRCRPMGNGAPPAWVSSLLERVDRRPSARVTDTDLRALSIDPARARRYFKSHYGMTFHAYHRARRMGMALADVRRGRHLTGTGYRHGFESESGFRDAFARVFGAPPGRGRGTRCLLARWLETPLGAMVAVGDDEGLGLLEFVERRALETEINALRRRFGCAIVPGENGPLERAAAELAAYFDGTLQRFTVPLRPSGTPFQSRVWERLLRIPYAQTASYSRIASDLGRPGAQRAVGRANGDNPIAIMVPCHRVVRSDGSLCGYGGGLWRKKWLLDHEKTSLAGFPHFGSVPARSLGASFA